MQVQDSSVLAEWEPGSLYWGLTEKITGCDWLYVVARLDGGVPI